MSDRGRQNGALVQSIACQALAEFTLALTPGGVLRLIKMTVVARQSR